MTFDWVLLGCVLFLSWATAYFVPMRLASMRRWHEKLPRCLVMQRDRRLRCQLVAVCREGCRSSRRLSCRRRSWLAVEVPSSPRRFVRRFRACPGRSELAADVPSSPRRFMRRSSLVANDQRRNSSLVSSPPKVTTLGPAEEAKAELLLAWCNMIWLIGPKL